MFRFNFLETPLKGLISVQRNVIEDDRGFLSRFYCKEEFSAAGFDIAIVQMNHTLTCKKGAIRGLHFQQSPYAETKVVSCLKGEIMDVAVDLRQGSPTYLQWHSEILSAKNRCSLIIPEGFAHGFQTLTEDCELIYLHTATYNPESEGALNVSDPELNINWPLPIEDLSVRDQNHSLIKNSNFQGLIL